MKWKLSRSLALILRFVGFNSINYMFFISCAWIPQKAKSLLTYLSQIFIIHVKSLL